jgi:segregation and condensation protein B
MSDETVRPEGGMLASAVGAMIFASDEPVPPREIAAALGGVELDVVEAAIDALREHYDRNDVGVCVERVAGGVRLATRPDTAPWLRQFFRQRNRTRLSAAALETLAIIAYRQPVTAPEIQAIRGKDPTAALKGLLDRGLIRCLGRKKVVGSPLLYGSSKQFLMHFGLDSLADLPSIEEFDQVLDALGAGERWRTTAEHASPAAAAPEPPAG